MFLSLFWSKWILPCSLVLSSINALVDEDDAIDFDSLQLPSFIWSIFISFWSRRSWGLINQHSPGKSLLELWPNLLTLICIWLFSSKPCQGWLLAAFSALHYSVALFFLGSTHSYFWLCSSRWWMSTRAMWTCKCPLDL